MRALFFRLGVRVRCSKPRSELMLGGRRCGGCGQEESNLVRLLHEVMVAFDKEVALRPKLYKVCARASLFSAAFDTSVMCLRAGRDECEICFRASILCKQCGV